MTGGGDETIYGPIADDLRARIDAGEFDKSKLLPSIAKLEAHYRAQGMKASQGTVRLALNALRADGLIRTYQGRATEVIAKPSEKKANAADLRDAVRRVDRLEQFVGVLDERVSQLTAEVQRLRGE